MLFPSIGSTGGAPYIAAVKFSNGFTHNGHFSDSLFQCLEQFPGVAVPGGVIHHVCESIPVVIVITGHAFLDLAGELAAGG